MCGIAGIVLSRAGEKARDGVALGMAARLRHRGPDAVRSWTSPDGRCSLGHARLKVIDLERGDQPMGDPESGVRVVFNGEIYNHRTLRRDLERAGHRFRTRSDTEVLVHGYEEWGQGLVERLEGMFAFGIWDGPRRRLVLARDRAGQKPLYWWQGPDVLAFASEMKAFRAIAGFAGTVDDAAIPYYLAYGYVPTPRTILRGVFKLPPASVAVSEGGGPFRQERYWRLDFTPKPIEPKVAVRRVRRALEDAVERRLESDVPLGAFLSGGVDSTAIVGLMSQRSATPVKTFSIGFEGAGRYDETPYASEAAQHFGTDHTEFMVGAESIELLDDLVDAYDEPFGDSSAIPTHVVSRLTREHVTVALTGDGGDELFAGYARFKGAQLAESVPGWIASLGRAVFARWPHHGDFRSLPRRAHRFFGVCGTTPEVRTLRWVGYFGDRLDCVLSPDLVLPREEELLASFSGPSSVAASGGSTSLSRALSLNFETYLPEDLLVKTDRCSMAHGLELRSPFFDTTLMELSASLPDALKIRRGVAKWILKEAVRDLVPARVLNRPKMGFAIPLPDWLRGPWRPLIEERLLVKDAPIGRWLSIREIRRIAEAHMSGGADYGHQLWALLTLDAWLRRSEGEAGAAAR